jgi:hypothetical protein
MILYESLLARAGLVSLELTRLRTLATEIYKSKNHLTPVYISDIFKVKTHKYNTRRKTLGNLYKPSVNTTHFGLHSMTFLGANLWNEIPSQARVCASLKYFKSAIEDWDGFICKCSMCKKL